MSPADIAQALHDAGYRPLAGGDRWAKPVAASLFVYDIGRAQWAQVFRALTGALEVYTTATWDGAGPFGQWLAYTEGWRSRVDVVASEPHNFHFRTSVQIAGLS